VTPRKASVTSVHTGTAPTVAIGVGLALLAADSPTRLTYAHVAVVAGLGVGLYALAG
jgi:hypothetical protein